MPSLPPTARPGKRRIRRPGHGIGRASRTPTRAAKAEKDAAAAKQDAADAGDATDKAKAKAKQAKAETQAAESKVKAAKGCAKAYIEAFGGLFEGGSVSGQAETVRKDLEGVTAGCKDGAPKARRDDGHVSRTSGGWARMSVRGAAFLGIGAMVGAGIFALLGEAGAIAGAAVWLSFLLAGIVAALLGYTVVKLGVRYPVLRRPDRLPRRGVRQRAARRDRLVAGVFRGDRDRVLDGRGRVRQLRNVAVHRRRRRGRLGQRVHLGGRPRDAGDQPRRLARGRSGPVADRRRAARRLRRLHRRDDRRHRLRPARVQRLSAAVGHRGQRRADVLRLPGLQRDHVLRGRPARPRARAAAGDVPRARA